MAKERKRLINNRDDLVNDPLNAEAGANVGEAASDRGAGASHTRAGPTSLGGENNFQVVADVEIVSKEGPEGEGPRPDLSPKVRGNQIQIVDDEEEDDDDQRDFFQSRR